MTLGIGEVAALQGRDSRLETGEANTVWVLWVEEEISLGDRVDLVLRFGV
jgi:hypothetical protein